MIGRLPALADGAALIGATGADILLDSVELGDAFERFGGNGRRANGREFVKPAANMGPAEGKLHIVALGERPIARIAVDLQDTREAGKVSDRLRGLAIGCVHVGDARWIGAAPRPVVTRVGPQLASLGTPTTRIEHRCGLVREQLGRSLQHRQQALVHRPQHEAGPADPMGQCRAVEFDALPGVDLSLAIERKVIGVFGDQNLRHRRLGRQSALDQPCRRGRLDYHVLAGPAGVFGPADHQHAELCRHDVEPFASILLDAMQRVAVARHLWSSISTTISTRGKCAGSDVLGSGDAWPENGSAFMVSRTSAARPSAPLRKPTGVVAIVKRRHKPISDSEIAQSLIAKLK
jgi:hypothetical protein